MKVLIVYAHPERQSFNAAFVDDGTRQRYTRDHEVRLRSLADTDPLELPTLDDLGPDWRLRTGIVPRAVGPMRSAAIF